MKRKLIMIAGPCAAETKEQISIAIHEGEKRHVDFLRVNLWKPRTKPGFEGVGEKGLAWMIDAAKAGVYPGTEVLTPNQAQIVAETVLKAVPQTKLLLWIGARNQNHFIQKEIAQIAAKDKKIFLLVKNQPWINEEHWEGIIEHVLSAGVKKENLINCHRGFSPHGDNPLGLRNKPDFVMAQRVREKNGIPVVFDPSHTGGNVPNVCILAKQAAESGMDGLMIEVHHDPKNALTDAKQQITWEEFDMLRKEWE